MSYDIPLDLAAARLVRLALKHEMERLEFRLQAVDGESDEAIDLANDLECLQIVFDRLERKLNGSE